MNFLQRLLSPSALPGARLHFPKAADGMTLCLETFLRKRPFSCTTTKPRSLSRNPALVPRCHPTLSPHSDSPSCSNKVLHSFRSGVWDPSWGVTHRESSSRTISPQSRLSWTEDPEGTGQDSCPHTAAQLEVFNSFPGVDVTYDDCAHLQTQTG